MIDTEKKEQRQTVKRVLRLLRPYMGRLILSLSLAADNVKKTQKRANALKNIMIPRYEAETRHIQNALDEKDREEFSRLKVIKAQKGA